MTCKIEEKNRSRPIAETKLRQCNINIKRGNSFPVLHFLNTAHFFKNDSTTVNSYFNALHKKMSESKTKMLNYNTCMY